MGIAFPNVGGGRSSEGEGGGLFLKLSSGGKINAVLRGGFKVYRTHWNQSQQRYAKCDGASCDLCNADEPKTRAKINVVTREDGVWVAKIWDMSLRTFIDLRELQESGYPLDETAITISRKGEKKDTKWTVLPLKNNGGLTEADFKAIAAIPLNPLTSDKGDDDQGDANEAAF